MPSNPQPYLRNAWYVAALSSEVGPEALFHRKLLDTSVMLYRRQDGTPVALRDRCPHRFAPLHLGHREGDEVACLYHGLRFDAEGRCTHNPHGDGRIPKAAQLQRYPLIERWGFLWIWMGDAPADPALLPDYGPLDEGHEHAVGHTYIHLKAHYELLIDNVMDLSHVDYVHSEIISTRGRLTPQTPRITETARSLSTRWEWTQTPSLLIFANFLPEPQAEGRHFIEVHWAPPANIQLSTGVRQDDGPLDLQHTVSQYDLHVVTPETADTTHYFFATRRNHRVDDADYNRFKIAAMHGAFANEDGPLIEAAHDEMQTADFFSLNPVLMSNDVSPVKVRRLLRKLIDAEAAAG
jgi:vanillate O-demethylase monooxygenase subunit